MTKRSSDWPLLPLNDGFDFPQLGVMAFRKDVAADVRDTINNFIEQGIRYFELSELYGNGSLVTDCFFDGGRDIPREKIYFSLKLWPKHRNKQQIIDSFMVTLKSVGLTYIDLAIIHAPIDLRNRMDQWKALEQLKHDGYVKSIGIANVNHTQLSAIMKNCTVYPSVVELEVTPFCQRSDLVEYCQDNNILVLCNSPMAKGIYDYRQELLDIAEEEKITVSEVKDCITQVTKDMQLLVRWSIIKKNAVLLPPTHNISDLNTLFHSLSADTMTKLDAMDEALVTSWETKEDDNDS